MRNYEGVFIVDPDLASDAAKGVIAQVQELITKSGGRIDSLQEWGKKRLAYKIGKKHDGNYFLVNFQVNSSQTKKIDQTLRLNDQILRFLLINKEEKR